MVLTISAEELSEMLNCLGLNRAKKMATTELAFMMIELQLASTKYYFLIKDVLNILEACLSAFDNDTRIYAKVIVAVFSRIYDLHNFDLILRQLSAEACNEVARRLGWLNILNPLKPSHDFVLPMKYLDNRIIIVMLLELSGNEGSEQIRMAPQTDISLVNLYGKIGRIITITNWTETTSMTYCEFGEKTDMVAWQARKDLVKRFLIGTPPQHPGLFRVVEMHAKLEEAGALGVGSIDLQYDDFLLKRN